MKKTLMMVFKTDRNQKATVTLADPKEELKRSKVVAVMQMMIEKAALVSKKGTPVEVEDVILKTVEETSMA